MWIILLVKTNKQAPYVIYFQPKHRSLPISHLHYFIFLVWESLFLFVVFLLVVLRLPHCYCCISSSSTEIISLMIFDNPFLGLKWSLRTHSLPTVCLYTYPTLFLSQLSFFWTFFFPTANGKYLVSISQITQSFMVSRSSLTDVLLIYFYILAKKECAKGKKTSNRIHQFEAQFHNQFDFQLFYYSN